MSDFLTIKYLLLKVGFLLLVANIMARRVPESGFERVKMKALGSRILFLGKLKTVPLEALVFQIINYSTLLVGGIYYYYTLIEYGVGSYLILEKMLFYGNIFLMVFIMVSASIWSIKNQSKKALRRDIAISSIALILMFILLWVLVE